jgi:transposase, IS5 family
VTFPRPTLARWRSEVSDRGEYEQSPLNSYSPTAMVGRIGRKNSHTSTPTDDLIRGDEAVVWADAAYDTHARRGRLKAEGKKPRIARRPNRHHPKLPARLKRYNRLIARRRAAVETTFATLKCRMRLTRIRYVGLAKARARVLLATIAFNMRRWEAIAG